MKRLLALVIGLVMFVFLASPGRAASADRSKRAWVLVAAATGTAANGRKTRRATIRLTRIPV